MEGVFVTDQVLAAISTISDIGIAVLFYFMWKVERRLLLVETTLKKMPRRKTDQQEDRA